MAQLVRRTTVATFVLAAVMAFASAAGARVLRVGTYHGIRGQYKTIQAAVKAAKPYDWILIGPGDYKTASSRAPSGHKDMPAGVLITKPDLRIRGMNRNKVVIDGTKRGTARCANGQSAQNFGPLVSGKRQGLNGLEVWKADDVWIQNLTSCNFLGGAGDAGNEIWWNGGANSGAVGGWGYKGSYLTATSTYYHDETTAAQYGIFTSNWSGGTWDVAYASNFNDSGFYIGACQQICHQTMNHAWAEYNALGYSGSNSGGWMLIENSRFDNNQDGFDTNSQNGDNPPPQNGACPTGVKPPVAGAHSCWVLIHNTFENNNNNQHPVSRERLRRAGGDGDVAVGRTQRHGDGQHVQEQRGLGTDLGPLSRQWAAVYGRDDEPARPRHLPLRRVERCADRQYVHQQRLLRQPDQRRLCRDQPGTRADKLLQRQPGHERQADQRALVRPDAVPDLQRADRAAIDRQPGVAGVHPAGVVRLGCVDQPGYGRPGVSADR